LKKVELKAIDLHRHRNYLKKINRKKKNGFTLIEVIAVIAIIGIMASVLLPKFTNYINEAKKLKVVEQSRKVVMAVEAYDMKSEKSINKENDTVNKVKGIAGVNKYFENINNDTNKLVGTMKIKECYDIVNGAEFKINEQGVFQSIVSSSSADISDVSEGE